MSEARAPSDRPSNARPRALGIVPARIGSTRLARKMLLEAGGLPLFVHTTRNAQRAGSLARVVVATDSDEVLRSAAAHGVQAIFTSPAHQSGTDRVHEAFELLQESHSEAFDVVVNIQGDEPELPSEHLDLLVAAFQDPSVHMATLCAPLFDLALLEDRAIVKVVRDRKGNALYFSRAPIPSSEHARRNEVLRGPLGWRHVGVYAYRPAALARFCALGTSALEGRENLEQLRWLEAGETLRCLEIDSSAPGIDTSEQFEAFRRSLESDQKTPRTRFSTSKDQRS